MRVAVLMAVSKNQGMEKSLIRHRNLLRLLRLNYSSDREFADAAGISPGFLSQLKMGGAREGGRNIGERLARRMERELGLQDGALDSETSDAPQSASVPTVATGAIRIPWLSARPSMGAGRGTDLAHDQQIRSFETTLQWVRAKLSKASSPENIRIVTGYGDSMRGTFSDGDALFVDTGITAIEIDAIFALQHDDELFIKRVQRLPGGGVKLISDNRNYDPVVVSAKDSKGFRVVGRVIGTMNFNEL